MLGNKLNYQVTGDGYGVKVNLALATNMKKEGKVNFSFQHL